jgi:predicted TIM-barrel fold metal-dependent hydrolase
LTINDAHCHFFSSRFLELLSQGLPDMPAGDRAAAVAERLGWAPPGTAAQLADRWVEELDHHGVSRAAIMASIPGDEESVVTAVALHPESFVGFFMFNPNTPDAEQRLARAFGDQRLRCACLFPAMHRYSLDDAKVHRVFEAAAAHEAAVFIHCGVLTVSVRVKLGLPCAFDLRLGDPLAVAAVASAYPTVPVIIPHFGAGFFRAALMAASQSRNVYLDTSSSNSWMKYYPGLTLDTVVRQTIHAIGPERLLFGTDSSYFPRGWQRGIFDQQEAALGGTAISDEERSLVLGGNFDRLFPPRI